MSSQDLADRYGTHRPRLRLGLLAASAVVGIAFLGWLAWVTVFHAAPPVESDFAGFDVESQHAATATVDITVRDEVTGTCVLRAFAEDHTTVGELSFEVTESGRYERTVRTEREATSVELVGCTAPGAPRPR